MLHRKRAKRRFFSNAFRISKVRGETAVRIRIPGGHIEAKYLEMLKSGGTLRHRELLAPFGLDASKPDFWNQGLAMISGLIDELEAM